MASPTISDVADLAGVSKSTVSAVINDKNTVKESTRQRVQEAIDELNYSPRPWARREFRSPAGKSLGLIIKEAQNPYYAEVLAGIQSAASEEGYVISVSSSEGDYEEEKRIARQFTEHGVNGLIIAPILDDESDLSHIFELRRRYIPLVLLESVRGIRASIIDVDNVMASYEAVRYLMSQGHSRIVHFAGPKYSQHSEERTAGVRHAFSKSRSVFDESFILQVGDALEDGYRVGLEYFGAAEDRPTAVTCYNDLVAIGLLRALRELEIKVPDEVSVVGFDNLALLDYLAIPLTTVSVPKFEMGYSAAQMLFRQIESRTALPQKEVTLDAHLVIRGTTRALPGGEKAAAEDGG